MRKLPLIAAVASAMWALPAFAEDGGITKPTATLAQFELCVGPNCSERVYRERERRYFNRYDDDWRYGYGSDWRYRRGDYCRDVTVRERRGDEDVVRRERRCD